MSTSDAEPDNWADACWTRAAACAETSCVEVAFVGDLVGVRDSKHPQRDPLVFSRAEWRAFTAGMRSGEFDV